MIDAQQTEYLSAKTKDIQQQIEDMHTPFDEPYVNEVGYSFEQSNDGGTTDYYQLKPEWKELQDIIEDLNMDWNQANILKAAYRLGRQNHSSKLRDINKIIWFANRIKSQLEKQS